MYTRHIKTNLVHSFLSLAFVDGITNNRGLEFSSTASLALCLADSMIRCYLTSLGNTSLDEKDAIFDVRHQATQYVKWWRQGYLSASGEPGIPDKTMEAALEIWEGGFEGNLSTTEILEKVEANQLRIDFPTSVVWVLPVALVFWRDRQKAAEFTRSAASVLSPASKHLAGWYVSAVVAVLWESVEKKDLRVGKTWLGNGFGEEFTRLGLQGVEEAENVRRGVMIFLETSSFGDGLRVAIRCHPQTSLAYAGIAGAWYSDGVGEEIRQKNIVGNGLVERVAGHLGALAKVLERRDEDEMQRIAAGVPLDDEFEGML